MKITTRKAIPKASRRKFLFHLGAVTAGSILSPILPMAGRKGIVQAEIGKISVRSYGASPDASPTDNVEAFQTAIDAAAKTGKTAAVFVPAGTYQTDNPIYMRDNVILQGEGAQSHIKNIAKKGLSPYTIMMGDYDGRSFLRGGFYSIEPVSKDATTIIFKNPEDAGKFRVGNIIIFQSEESFRGDKRPEFQEINEVTAIADGRVTIKYPLHADLGGANPKVQRSGDPSNRSVRDNTAKIVKRAEIRDLAISSNGSWMSLGGAFECLIENLHLDSAAIVNLNGFARSTMRRIQANYWRRMIHLAYYCHHSLVEDVQATYRAGSPDAPGAGIILGEGCHNNTIRNIDIESDDTGGYRTALSCANCNYNEITRVRARLFKPPEHYILEFRGNIFKCIGNTFSDCDIQWYGVVKDVVRFNPPNSNAPEKVANNKVLNSSFNGNASNYAVALYPGMNNEIDSNFFSSGGYFVHGASINNKITNNRFLEKDSKRVIKNHNNTIKD